MYYKKILPYVIGATAFASGVACNESNPGNTDDRKDKIENVDSSANVDTRDTLSIIMPIMPVSVEEQGKSVIYVYNNGRRVVRQKGTRAWRNNNPGNLRYYQFAKEHGAIGEAGNFAVFPDEKTGMQALYKLLQTESYRNLTIANALKRYAAPTTWQSYTQKLTRITGLSENTKLRDLTPEQLTSVAQTIRRIEGWVPGNEQEINSSQYAMARINQQKVR